MASESIQLLTRDKQTAKAMAEITRYSDTTRLMRAGVVAIGGTVIGLCTIVIPVMHLISTWLIPLISWAIAWHIFGIQTVIGSVKGTCPGCDKAIELDGGPLASDLWARCPHCALPMQYVVGADALSGGAGAIAKK